MKRIAQPQRTSTLGFFQTSSVAWIAFVVLLSVIVTTASARAQTITALYWFMGKPDAGIPKGSLIRDPQGNFYGTTFYGGFSTNCDNGPESDGCGTVYKVDAAGIETVLHSFQSSDGRNPVAGVVHDAAGNLYGTTQHGGNPSDLGGYGLVFKLDSAGNETILYSFSGKSDGAYPTVLLRDDATGYLYGIAGGGGNLNCYHPDGCGTIFKLDDSGRFRVLHRFAGGVDGVGPSSLVRDAAGTLYGVTLQGGAYNLGTVFKLEANGNETILHNFGEASEGQYPSSVILDSAGNLYGTTLGGGRGVCVIGCGLVYEVDTGGNFVVLHEFTGKADGSFPTETLVQDSAGNLYGSAQFGGDLFCEIGGLRGCGTVFKVSTTGKFKVLYTFGADDHTNPVTWLLRDKAGNLYGYGADSLTDYGWGALVMMRPGEMN